MLYSHIKLEARTSLKKIILDLQSKTFRLGWVLCFLFNTLYASSNYSIIFVHIGESLPPHVEIALSQAST